MSASLPADQILTFLRTIFPLHGPGTRRKFRPPHIALALDRRRLLVRSFRAVCRWVGWRDEVQAEGTRVCVEGHMVSALSFVSV